MTTARSLRVDRASVQGAAGSASLKDLLSHQILVEWQPSQQSAPDRYVLAFPHNILFDYAVSRMLFRGDPKNVLDRLAKDRDLILVIRPSVVFHFQSVWESDGTREAFWDLVKQVVQRAEIPEIAKIVGPSVAVEMARTLADCRALCVLLDSKDVPVREAGEKALGYLVGSLISSGEKRVLLGAEAGPWCELAEYLSQALTQVRGHWIRLFLIIASEGKNGTFTADQSRHAGQASRRLLEFGMGADNA